MDPLAHPPRQPLRRAALPALLAALLALLASACLPAGDGAPRVALLNAPRPVAVDGLADRAQRDLQRFATDPGGYGFVDRASLAFLETRSNLDDSAAAANAARLARNRGGAVAVMIGAPRVEREIVRGKDDEPVVVLARASAEAVVVRASDGAVLERVVGPVVRGARPLTRGDAPPDDPRADPAVRDLALRSLDALAPFLDAALRRALALAP